MRIVLFLMILSLGLSGFTAASHAFSGMGTVTPAAADTMSDCPDHAQKSDDSGHGKGLCLDCHHCCTLHAVPLPAFVLTALERDNVLNPLPVPDFTGRYPASLLRPPQSLV